MHNTVYLCRAFLKEVFREGELAGGRNQLFNFWKPFPNLKKKKIGLSLASYYSLFPHISSKKDITNVFFFLAIISSVIFVILKLACSALLITLYIC